VAVAFDATSIDTGSGETGNLSWTHTPVGTPRGVVVYVIQGETGGTETTDQVSAVTYGGVSMTRLGTVAVTESTVETLRTYAYFLGASLPTGAQTVAVTVAASAIKDACAVTVTAAANTEVVDWEVGSSTNTNQLLTATLSLASKTSFVSTGFTSGENIATSNAALTGWTLRHATDLGSHTGGLTTYNTVGTSDVAGGFDLSADSATAIAVAVSEVVAGDASVALTGVGTTASAGSIAATGEASVALTGATSTSAAGTLTASAGADATATLTGASSTSEAGTVQASAGGNASVALTGASVSATAGALAASGHAQIMILGASAVAAAGTVSASSAALATGASRRFVISSAPRPAVVTISRGPIVSLPRGSIFPE
jgi:hypothetical protein